MIEPNKLRQWALEKAIDFINADASIFTNCDETDAIKLAEKFRAYALIPEE